MRLRTLALHALAFAAVAAPLHAQTTPAATVAVLDFGAFSLSLEDAGAVGKGAASMIITELAGRPGIRVVERQQIQNLLQEQRLQLSGRVEDAQALEIGRMLGARYMITGNVALGAKEDTRVDIRVFDVETSEILRTDKLRGKQDDFFDLMVQVVDQFTEQIELETGAAPASRIDVEIPFQATLFYSRGLDYEDRGDTPKAVEMYRKALEAFPAFVGARDALSRLEGQGGAP